jgi:hypothetical protein
LIGRDLLSCNLDRAPTIYYTLFAFGDGVSGCRSDERLFHIQAYKLRIAVKYLSYAVRFGYYVSNSLLSLVDILDIKTAVYKALHGIESVITVICRKAVKVFGQAFYGIFTFVFDRLSLLSFWQTKKG